MKLTKDQTAQLTRIVTEAKSPESIDESKVLATLTSQQRTELGQLVGAAFDLSKILRIGANAPELAGIENWINSKL